MANVTPFYHLFMHFYTFGSTFTYICLNVTFLLAKCNFQIYPSCANRTPAFYQVLEPSGWRNIRIFPIFTLKTCIFKQKSGILFKMAF